MFRIFKRDKSIDGTVVAQYEPPQDITAPELGVIFDGKAGRLEFLAALYECKTKKIISIDNNAHGRTTVILLHYQPDSLTAYEDLLLRYLFHDTTEVILQEVFEKLEYIMLLTYFQYLLLQTLHSKNLIVLNGLYTQPYHKYLESVLSDPVLYFKEIYSGLQSRELTPLAKSMLPSLKGFKHYIETAELDKIKFHAGGDLRLYIEKLTPYAIAFNQLERWALIGIPVIVTETSTDQPASSSTDPFDAAKTEMLDIIKLFDSYTITPRS